MFVLRLYAKVGRSGGGHQASKFEMTDALRFVAQIIKVQTMQDMAIRVTFDLPESLTDIARDLMEAKRRGAILEIAAIPVEQVIEPKKQDEEQEKHAIIPTRSEWEP
jgi:hypothetical protein